MSNTMISRDLSRSCFICGAAEDAHTPAGEHAYWATRDALAEADEYDRKVVAAGGARYPSMSAVETLDPREAVVS